MVPLQRTELATVLPRGDPIVLTAITEPLEFYHGLETPEQAAVQFGIAVLLGIAVLGLAPGHGTGAVRTATRSPVISAIVGVPGTLALGTMSYAGYVLAGSNVGIFFAVPLLAVGATLLPAWIAVGITAVGGVLARRVGIEQQAGWLLVGSGLIGLAAFFPVAGVAVLGLAAAVGVGAGARTLFGTDTAQREDRVVPPANKV
ncbi:hypothetical protein [Natrialbaceae archaeon AArc-T1-2]|uniref:hypothetical protein n=1 Tax=Natrialbaceae archaeon AArc-T1-2 TaxID=3053904 RepID=UPI00255AFE3E|nr:hypothetical protein [Natrialbaceae archaeon AArc-T1-2]WIV65927.1 hypothetical protein QQ977_09475 [Natrialbaceae archaeon AArc-T1-2]